MDSKLASTTYFDRLLITWPQASYLTSSPLLSTSVNYDPQRVVCKSFPSHLVQLFIPST